MGKVISINNFKGGVSKTSTTCLLAYVLSEKMDKKVLLVDFDPQADATELMLRTFKDKPTEEILENEVTMYEGLKNHYSRSECTLKLSDNLDLIPSDFDLIGLPKLLIEKDSYEKVKSLNHLLEGVRDEYDFILIDTPPTISDFSNNAIYACDYSLIVMQTHRRSYRSVNKFIEHLVDFQETYECNFDILGIIPVMFSNATKIDEITLKDTIDSYQSHVFQHVIKHMERVKYWDEYGIGENDHWDRVTLRQYEKLTDEFIEKINKKVEA